MRPKNLQTIFFLSIFILYLGNAKYNNLEYVEYIKN